MKIRSLLCVAIASIVSTQGLALQITHGKLLHHKEWTTNGAKGQFLLAKSPINSMHFNSTTEQGGGQVISDTESPIIHGQANTETTITGDGGAYAHNKSNETRTYFLHQSSCAIISDKIQRCMFATDEIQLDPDGVIESDTLSNLKVVFTTPGNYVINQSATVTDETLSNSTSSASYGTAIIS